MNISNLKELINLGTAVFGFLTGFAALIKQKRDSKNESAFHISQNQIIKEISTNGDNSHIHINAQQINKTKYFQAKEAELKAEEYKESFAANRRFTQVFYILLILFSVVLICHFFPSNNYQNIIFDSLKLTTSLLAVMTIILIIYEIWKFIRGQVKIKTSKNFFINSTRFCQIILMPLAVIICQIATWGFIQQNLIKTDDKFLFILLFLISSYQFFVISTQIFWGNIYIISFVKDKEYFKVYRILLFNLSIFLFFIVLINVYLINN